MLNFMVTKISSILSILRSIIYENFKSICHLETITQRKIEYKMAAMSAILEVSVTKINQDLPHIMIDHL